MLHRLAIPILQPGVDFYEIGLMAAASPEFAAAMGQKIIESVSGTGASGIVAAAIGAGPGTQQDRASLCA